MLGLLSYGNKRGDVEDISLVVCSVLSARKSADVSKNHISLFLLDYYTQPMKVLIFF